jgi:hypothetical protein
MSCAQYQRACQGDLEWYDPMEAYTKNGSLWLTIDNAELINNHNMSYVSCMVWDSCDIGTLSLPWNSNPPCG